MPKGLRGLENRWANSTNSFPRITVPYANSDFYSSSPAAYFFQRFNNLLVLAANGEEINDILRRGVKFGKIDFQLAPLDPSTSVESLEANNQHIVVIETETLIHHVSESLLRLYLAHEDLPPCPWAKLAALKNPSDFKQLLTERFPNTEVTDGSLRRVSEVFFGLDMYTEKPAAPNEWWEPARIIYEYLEYLSSRLSDKRDAYNAVKHGLGVNPSAHSLSVDDETGLQVSKLGLTLQFLTTESERGVVAWYQNISWVNLDESIALIGVAIRLLEILWLNARQRYMNPQPAHRANFVPPRLRDLLKANRVDTDSAVGAMVSSFKIKLT